MSDRETRDIVELQQQIASRLREVGFPEGDAARRLAHHLGEIAVLSRNFAEHTLPLFLSVGMEHGESLARLSVSIKWDLDEIRDAITDVERDAIELMEFLNRQ